MLTFIASAGLPLLRLLDPERAHGLALRAIAMGLVPAGAAEDDPRLAVEAIGRRFGNPIGLAAGFDKNAAGGPALLRMGFGFVETGTVTPLPQAGNPRPRLFRLTRDGAVINRFGFNNDGLDAYRIKLARLSGRRIPLGANVGINKDGAEPVRDYPALIAAVRGLADYAVINVSSPNTPNLRDLQAGAPLRAILQAVAAVPDRPPVLVKIAPDLTADGLEAVVETCAEAGIAGLIVGNTTSSRPHGLTSPYASEAGGLSGRPLWSLSTAVLARACLLARGRLLLIGAGGIFTGQDVLTKVQAGASLVQLYTSFAYAGPALLPRIKRELLAAMDAAGVATIQEARGTRAQLLAEQG
jgi:dihydroorotate dehydrogenase